MILKFKKLSEDAEVPSVAREGDAGMDLKAVSIKKYSDYIEYGTGLAVEISQRNVALLFPRSSISNTGHRLLNSVGVIDSGYRGEIKVRMSWTDRNAYQLGDKIAQLMILELPSIMVEEVQELSCTERGDEGFGSTGK